jgi:hypothetical protein
VFRFDTIYDSFRDLMGLEERVEEGVGRRKMT